ncbi:hypothetical protein ACFVWG_29870 [Kribbella sp. NPDC058245]|uniref:hypothetical protein n=1 Tax=Kribbella sp. NPDC058245 TaxID=3346399 RepID=UPI0036E1150A
MSVQLDGAGRMAQFTLLVSGEAELDKAVDGEMLPPTHFQDLDADAVWRALSKMLEFVRSEVR